MRRLSLISGHFGTKGSAATSNQRLNSSKTSGAVGKALLLPALDPARLTWHKKTRFPEQYRHLISGREKVALGDPLGLTNFGVNLVHLEPGSYSSLRHYHELEDEFIYVLEGEVTLITNGGPQVLKAGQCAGFPKGKADGHHFYNHSKSLVKLLEVGDRRAFEKITFPDAEIDLKMSKADDPNGALIPAKKDGTLYPI